MGIHITMSGLDTMGDEKMDPVLCTICRLELKGKKYHLFGGAPICDPCYGSMELDELDHSRVDEALKDLVDGTGLETLGYLTSLAEQMPQSSGWNMLAMIEEIGKDLEEEQGRRLVTASTMICGNMVVRMGKGSGEPEPTRLTLMLILGQVIDLSIMKRIVLDRDLRTSHRLDELRLIGEHQKVIFDLISSLDPEKDPFRENVMANCLTNIL